MYNLTRILDQPSSGVAAGSYDVRSYLENIDWDGMLVANIPELLNRLNVVILEEGDSWVIIKGNLPLYFGNNQFVLSVFPYDDIDADINELRKDWDRFSEEEKNNIVELILKGDPGTE